MCDIPIYPCSICSIIEQTVCMSCQKAEQYIAEINKLTQKYNVNVAILADKIARLKGNIARAENELDVYVQKYERAKTDK